MTACVARLCLVIAALLGMPPNGALALQRAQSDPSSPRTFQELFQQYLHGDADGAVRAFAVWDDDRIEREADLPPGDAGLKPALALFHSDGR